MKQRRLGKTELLVSEIGFGGEWLEHHPEEEGAALIRYAASQGINILDCWMADPKSREIIGRESGKTAAIGSFRAISAPPGKTGSMSARGIWRTSAPPSRIF